MRITKRQLRRIIKEELELLRERREPGHKDPETGNWQYPGDPNYDPRKDPTLDPVDGGWGQEEYTKALQAHPRGGPVDRSWEHPMGMDW